MRPIETLLVSNRGEIARRILRTARALGMRTVVACSEADLSAPFVREADEAVVLGPAPPADSYLRVEAVLEAARRTGADAVHPGYGFLAENPALAAACAEAGLRFVGPSAEAMARLGDKARARVLAATLGIPTLQGHDGEDGSVEAFAAAAERVGYPVLLKAAAGGGGRGMRRVERPEELAAAVREARREAEAAFGDGRLLLERWLHRPRHVEVQLLADAHGRVAALGERECSVQRRHQKLLEESPSPAVDEALRERLQEAARRLLAEAGYVGAATVEFLLDEDGAFYFLEVNTRLQVEHPVTELRTGLDLVAEQLRVAEGRPLSWDAEQLAFRGHAIEVRLCAEDPLRGDLPQQGRLLAWDVPLEEGVRLDSGVEAGSEVSGHYDSLLAKVVAWGSDRETARRRLLRALRGAFVAGVTVNRELLVRVLEHPDFVAGRIDTAWLGRQAGALRRPLAEPERHREAAVAATVAALEGRRHEGPLPLVPVGFRNVPGPEPALRFQPPGDGAPLSVGWRDAGGGRWTLRLDGSEGGRRGVAALRWRAPEPLDAGGGAARPGELLLRDGDRVTRWRWLREGPRWWLHDGRVQLELHEVARLGEDEAATGEEPPRGDGRAPMAGRLLEVRVVPGERLEAGAVVAVLEAMKMTHEVRVDRPCRVAEVLAREGAQVEAGQPLLRLALAEEGADDEGEGAG